MQARILCTFHMKVNVKNYMAITGLLRFIVKRKNLNQDGMVCDFKHIKDKIHGYLDHGNLNELLPFNPTAENIAKWITDQIPECYKTKVQESGGNTAIYEIDDFENENIDR